MLQTDHQAVHPITQSLHWLSYMGSCFLFNDAVIPQTIRCWRRMVGEWQIAKDLEGDDNALTEVVPQQFLGRTGEKHDKYDPGQPASQQVLPLQ